MNFWQFCNHWFTCRCSCDENRRHRSTNGDCFFWPFVAHPRLDQRTTQRPKGLDQNSGFIRGSSFKHGSFGNKKRGILDESPFLESVS